MDSMREADPPSAPDFSFPSRVALLLPTEAVAETTQISGASIDGVITHADNGNCCLKLGQQLQIRPGRSGRPTVTGAVSVLRLYATASMESERASALARDRALRHFATDERHRRPAAVAWSGSYGRRIGAGLLSTDNDHAPATARGYRFGTRRSCRLGRPVRSQCARSPCGTAGAECRFPCRGGGQLPPDSSGAALGRRAGALTRFSGEVA